MTGDGSGRAAFLSGTDVSRETTARLDLYAGLLSKWNTAINLVAPSTLKTLWQRHFLDSAQVFSLIPTRATIYADLGTGGGFPGLIVAILAAESRPDLRVICVESDQRKAAFLRTVVRETGIGAEILPRRIEMIEPLGADVVSARALAPLGDLLGYAQRHLAPDGQALFLKGAEYRREIDAARSKWAFDMDAIPSKTEPEAVILKLGGIRRV